MKLDILDSCDSIRICTGYRRKGELYQEFPNETGLLKACEPIYEEMPGWMQNIAGITSYDRLPAPCRAYVERLEALTGVEVGLISTGPRRDQTIVRPTPSMRRWRLAK